MITGRRLVRCYDCGLDYRPAAIRRCPRCGETRIVDFRDLSGFRWLLGLELAGVVAMLCVVILQGWGRL